MMGDFGEKGTGGVSKLKGIFFIIMKSIMGAVN